MNQQLTELIAHNNDATVFKALGIIIEKLDQDETIVSLTVDERHYQHLGLVHGGIFVLLAESAASLAAASSLATADKKIVALEINANHVRMVKDGLLKAHSHCLHRGRRTMIYEVKVVDGQKKIISIARCTLMVVDNKKPY